MDQVAPVALGLSFVYPLCMSICAAWYGRIVHAVSYFLRYVTRMLSSPQTPQTRFSGASA